MNFNDDDNMGSAFSGGQYATEPQTSSYTDVYEDNKASILTNVFTWMAAGLAVSAMAAFGAYKLVNPMTLVNLFVPFAIVELILVLVFSFKISSMSPTVAKICFLAYSFVNGVTLSSIFFVYDINSIYSTFFICAAMFAGAAFYGKTTKNDLSKMGSILMMGLFGIIIAGIVNIFLNNSMLDFGITIIGIVLFLALTAYDVHRLSNLVNEWGISSDEDSVQRIVIYGALQLYLDFINLFLKLLRIMAKQRRNN